MSYGLVALIEFGAQLSDSVSLNTDLLLEFFHLFSSLSINAVDTLFFLAYFLFELSNAFLLLLDFGLHFRVIARRIVRHIELALCIFQLIAESLDLLVKTTKHRCGLVLEEDNLLAFVLSPLLVTLSNRLPQSKLKIRLAK